MLQHVKPARTVPVTGGPSPRRPAALQDTQSAKLSFLNKVQQCFAVRKGLEGMLDLAREVFCRATEQVHELMATYREQHSLDCLKVGTCLWPWLPISSAQGSSISTCNEESSCKQHGLDSLKVGINVCIWHGCLLEISNICRVALAQSGAPDTVWNSVSSLPYSPRGCGSMAPSQGSRSGCRLCCVPPIETGSAPVTFHLTLHCASVQVQYTAKRGFYMVLQRPGTSLEGGSTAPDLPAGFLPLQSRGTSSLDCTTQELNTLNVRLAKAASDCLILTEQVCWPDQPTDCLCAASFSHKCGAEDYLVPLLRMACILLSVCEAKARLCEPPHGLHSQGDAAAACHQHNVQAQAHATPTCWWCSALPWLWLCCALTVCTGPSTYRARASLLHDTRCAPAAELCPNCLHRPFIMPTAQLPPGGAEQGSGCGMLHPLHILPHI